MCILSLKYISCLISYLAIRTMSDKRKPKSRAGRKEQPKIASPAVGVGASSKTPLKVGEIFILYTLTEGVKGAVSFDTFIDNLLTVLRKEVPGYVANEIYDEVSGRPTAPVVPKPPRQLTDEPTEEEINEYGLARATYEADIAVYPTLTTNYLKDLNSYKRDSQKACAIFWSGLSKGMQERILHENPGMRTCDDLIELKKASRRNHSGARAQSERTMVLNAEIQHVTIQQRKGETLPEYYKRYEESAGNLEDRSRGNRSLSPHTEAINFIRGLGPNFESWKVEMANLSAAYVTTGKGEDPYPESLEEAYALASSRYSSTKSTSTDLGEHVNSLVRKALQESEKPRGKTHAAKPSDGDKDKDKVEGNSECHVCQGALNHLTDGKPHYAKSCPFSTMDAAEKKKVFSMLGEQKPKKKSVKLAVRSQEDEDDEDDDSDIAGVSSLLTFVNSGGGTHIARPTVVLKAVTSKYTKWHAMLDNGANVRVLTNKLLLESVVKNDEQDTVDTANGDTSYSYVGTSHLFGKVYYDPNGKLNILDYASMCRQFSVVGHKSDPREPEDYFTVTGPQLRGHTVVFRRDHNDVYVTNLRSLYKAGVLTGVANCAQQAYSTIGGRGDRKILPDDMRVSAAQARSIEELVRNPRGRSYMSLEHLYLNIRNGHLTNAPFTANDVRRAIQLRVPDKSELRGRETQAHYHALKLADGLGINEMALHGDLFFLFGIVFLIAVTEPGGYSAVHYLPKGKGTKSVYPEIKEIIDWLKGHGWIVRVLAFDGERAIGAMSQDLNALGVEVIIYPSGTHDQQVDNRIRTIKERARSFYDYIMTVYDCFNAKMVPLLAIGSAFAVNMIASSTNVNNMPPVTFVTRMILDYRLHMAASFGDYVETKVPPTARAPSNSMAPRTQSGIALWPDLRGRWFVYLFLSEKVVKRQQIKILSPTADIIAAMRSLAVKYPLSGTIDDSDQLAPYATSRGDDLEESVVDIANPAQVDDLVPDSGVVPDTQRQGDNAFGLQRVADEASGAQDHAHGERVSQQPEAPTVIHEDIEPATAESDQSRYIDGIEAGVSNGAHVLPRKKKALWKERVITRGLQKSTRSGHVYASILRSKKDNLIFSAQGTLSLRKAMAEYGEEARKALIEEINNMLSRKVWTGVLRNTLSKRQRKAIIRSHTFMKEKMSPSNVFLRLKARLVAMGNLQDRSLYTLEDTKSPTVAQSSSYILLATAANERRSVLSFDVNCAYLNADMNSEVIMELNPLTAELLSELDPNFKQFQERDGKMLVKLNKALYGCIESAKLWYERFKSFLVRKGFAVNPYDPCVFNRYTEAGVQCTVFFHVDDGIATCADEQELDRFLQELLDEFGEVRSTRGKVHEFLGLVLDFSEDGICTITAPRLTEEAMQEYQIKSSVKTPALSDLYALDEESKLLEEPARRKFHSVVQKLLYIGHKCRLDILPAVSFLTTRVTKATVEDQEKLIRTLKYLHGSMRIGLRLGGDASGYVSVQVYADASYGVWYNAKSHTGIAITLGRGAVVAKSSRQNGVAKSSTEAELYSQCDSVGPGSYVLNFMAAQGYDIDTMILHQDNQATISMTTNGRSNSDKTRHIKIRYFFIKELIDSGEVRLVYTPTDKMVADALTKPLQGDLFVKMRDKLLGYELP